jgi:hypothetical protein
MEKLCLHETCQMCPFWSSGTCIRIARNEHNQDPFITLVSISGSMSLFTTFRLFRDFSPWVVVDSYITALEINFSCKVTWL